jgi:hypothetical protein
MNKPSIPATIDAELLNECYSSALELLRQNSTPDGILACRVTEKAVGRHYTSIFGRDASICALGMIASGETGLIESARASILTLARYQAPNGQIPKYVKPQIGEADFWYTGCIDATLWWLIAIRFLDAIIPGDQLGKELAANSEKAIHWLKCQEHQVWYLLQQNEASDWADIMPRSGFVFYSNVLWFWVKKLFDIPTAWETRDYANLLFFPFSNRVPEHRRARLLMHYIRNRAKRTPFYLSFVNFSIWGDEVDIFGNILAVLTGLADTSMGCSIVSALPAIGACSPYPIRVVGTPIERENPLWRPYMQRHRQNLPWQYHNGGIWPFVGGFWVMLLARLGMDKEAWSELESLARANRVNNWEFNEWFHGKTGEPMGMPGQSWNAALFILAYRTLRDGIRFIP